MSYGDLTFSCPVCGVDVPRKAKSCPNCGACEKSGWSQDRYLDGVFLPGEEEPIPKRSPGASNWMTWVTVLLLIAFVLLMLRR